MEKKYSLVTLQTSSVKSWAETKKTGTNGGNIKLNFIIPIFLYRTSSISLDKEFVKEANKIIFDFIWKGKDKVKRSALVSDIEDGGLKAPHLNSIIET